MSPVKTFDLLLFFTGDQSYVEDDASWDDDSGETIIFCEKEARKVLTAVLVWYNQGLDTHVRKHTTCDTQMCSLNASSSMWRSLCCHLREVQVSYPLTSQHLKISKNTQYASTTWVFHVLCISRLKESVGELDIHFTVLFPTLKERRNLQVMSWKEWRVLHHLNLNLPKWTIHFLYSAISNTETKKELTSHVMRRVTGPTSFESKLTKMDYQRSGQLCRVVQLYVLQVIPILFVPWWQPWLLEKMSFQHLFWLLWK
jgi:hypothetical protein